MAPIGADHTLWCGLKMPLQYSAVSMTLSPAGTDSVAMLVLAGVLAV